MNMRRILLVAVAAVVVLSLGVVAFTQRSGPTAEDKALAARLIQEALRDALLSPDPGERAEKLTRVVRTARNNADGEKPAVGEEEALNLLRKALEDAEALPADQQESALSQVLQAVAEIDSGQAAQWAEEERKHGRPVPPWLLGHEETPVEPAGEVDETATNDLPAAIRQAQQLPDPHQRLEAKLRLGHRLMSAGLWRAQGEQLLEESATLAERMAAEPGGQHRLLRVARAVAAYDSGRALSLFQKAYEAAAAIPDTEDRVKALLDIGNDEGYLGLGGATGGGGDAGGELQALRARAVEQAATAALKLPEGSETRGTAIRMAFRIALENPGEDGPAQFDVALRWARALPVADGSRSRALAEVADKARSVNRGLADELVGEARDTLPPLDSNWNAVTARASTIALAALSGDKRCWDWASQDAALIRRSEMPAMDGKFEVPVELKRVAAESMVLGATFACGDIQRARKFVERQAKLGGYEVARALWAVVVYLWDPSMSLELADKLLADLQPRQLPAGGCTAALAVAPAFAYRSFFPDAEVSERAAPLLDRALDLIAASPQAMDRAFAAAGLAVACAAVDGTRSARAVSIAREGLAAIGDEKTREALAEPICGLVAIADPQTAAAMTSDIRDPGARLNARLAAAQAMRFDLAEARRNWPAILAPAVPVPPPVDAEP